MKILSSEGKEITIGDITGNGGDMLIGSENYNGTVNLNSVEQDSLHIDGGTVNADAEKLIITNGIENDADLNLTGAILASSIRGTGSTSINESMTSDKTIVQNNLSVAQDTEFTTNANIAVNESLSNSGTINNSAVFNITSSTSNEGVIKGSGTLDLDADFVNNGTITQNTITNSGRLTNTENKEITVESRLSNSGSVHNDGLFTLKGTNNTGKFDGEGTLRTQGSITNNSTIEQKNLEIVSGSFTTNASNISISNGIVNNETLVLTGGTLNSAVSGPGTTDLDGDTTINVAITDNTLIADNNNIILGSEGALDLGGFVAGGGSLSTQNSKIDDIALGDVILQGDMNISIDANLAQPSIDTFSANTIEANGNSIIIDSIYITEDPVAGLPITLRTFDDVLREYVRLNAEDFYTEGVTPDSSYLVTYEKSDGTLTFGKDNLYNAIHDDASERVYNMSANELVNKDLETMEGDNATLTVNGNNFAVEGNEFGGVTIEEDDTLVLNNVSAWSGFNGNGITNKGTVDVNADTTDTEFGETFENTGNLNIGGSADVTFDADVIGATGEIAVNTTGEVNFNDDVTQKDLTINSGVVNVDAGDLNITNTVENDGTLNLTGDEALTSSISGEGRTNINGSISTNKDIEQGALGVAEGKTFSTSANTTVNEELNNDGTISNAGNLYVNGDDQTLGAITNNAGDLYLQGSGDYVADKDITQNAVNIGADVTLDNNAKLTADITNEGTLKSTGDNINGNVLNDDGHVILEGGEFSHEITGYGTTSLDADTVNNGLINQDIVETNGHKLTNNADKELTVGLALVNDGAIENNGEFNVDGLSYDLGEITGSGVLNVSGELKTANKDITQDKVNVAERGSLKINANLNADLYNNGETITQANNLKGVVNNEGTLTFTGGETQSDVQGSGKTVIENTVTLKHSTGRNRVEIGEDATLQIRDGGSIASNRGLIAKGGTIDVLDGDTSDLNLGRVDISQGDLNVKIDADLENEKADKLTGRLVNSTTVEDEQKGTANVNGHKIMIDQVEIISETEKETVNIVVADNNLKSVVALSDSASVAHSPEGLAYLLSYQATNGELTFDVSAEMDLYRAVHSPEAQKVYTTSDSGELVTRKSLGELNGQSLVVNAHDTAIKGTGTTDGITVKGYTDGSGEHQGQRLVFNDVDEYSGFNTALNNEDSASTLELNNVTFKDNSLDVNNDGNMYLNGDIEFNDGITGTGTTEIKSGTTTFNSNDTVASKGDVTQSSITVDEGANAIFNSNVTSDVTNSGTVDNNNKLTGDVTNSGTFANVGGSISSENIVNTGNFVNADETGTGTIESDNFINGNDDGVEAVFTTNISDVKISSDGALTNKDGATLNITGGTNTNTINGDGTTNINGDMINDGTITQDNINIAEGVDFVNNANKELTVNEKLANNGTIENNGTFNANGASYELGSISGNGELNVSGELKTANKDITQDKVNVADDGSLDIFANLNADLFNDGLTTSNADNLKGSVNNEGTLTLTGGSTQSDIAGDGKTVIENTVTLNNSTGTNTVELSEDSTLAIRNGGDISSNQSLISKGGTVDVLDGETSDLNLGRVDITQGDLNVKIDADLANVQADKLTGELLGTPTVEDPEQGTANINGHKIMIDEVSILSDGPEGETVNIVVADENLKSVVALSDDAQTSESPSGMAYLLAYQAKSGELSFEGSAQMDLYHAVHSPKAQKVYTTSDEGELVTRSSLGELNGQSLVVNAHDTAIKGTGTTDGITVKGYTDGSGEHQGQRLVFNDVDEYSGFNTALNNEDSASTLELNNVTFKDNSLDVNNDGNMYLNGDIEFNDGITGTGTTEIKSGTTTFNSNDTVASKGDVTQSSITVDEGANAIFNSNVTSDVTNSGTVDNNNKLTGDVTNSGTFANVGGSISSENIVNTGNFVNADETGTGTIESDNFINGNDDGVEAVFTTNISDVKISSDGALTNKDGATLNITGGTNTNKIDGNGTTNINGSTVNTGSISQGDIIVNGTNFTNEASVKATNSFVNRPGSNVVNTEDAALDVVNLDNDSSIFNNGEMFVAGNSDNGGSITGAGSFTNNGDLVNTGVIQQDSIVNNGNITTNANNFGLNTSANSIVNNEGAKITFNGGTINSNISGAGDTVLDSPDKIAINSRISGNNVSFNNGELFFGQNADLSQANSFAINGGTMNMMDNQVKQINLGNNVTLNGNTELAIDFNVDNMTSDSFATRPTATNNAKFHISQNHFNLMGKTVNNPVTVDLGETTNVGHENLSTDTFDLPTVMTPVRKISGRVSDGYLTYGPTGNSYSDFNPAIMTSSVAAQGGYMTQLNSYEEAFKNLDMKMLMTQEERKALKMANSYASAETPQTFNEIYLPEKDNAMWSRSYATFEKVNLHNGPKVNNTMYGTYYGGDTKMHELSNGADVQYSGYIGYNGATQSYDGVSLSHNSASAGVSATLYKDKFFAAVTTNVGAGISDASTQYGSEDIPMIMAGVAAKTGYNFEFQKGKFIVQPSLLMSYTNVNTLNHKNPVDVKVKGKSLNALQIAPELKVIGNFKNGWQPYASVRMVWNLLDDTHYTADGASLPNVSVDPYVQYGLGVQKRWGEVFTGYAQAMARSGGRNGVALNAGFRWALGYPYEQTEEEENDSMVENQTQPNSNPQLEKQITNLNAQQVINDNRPSVKRIPDQTVVVPTANVQPTRPSAQSSYIFRAPVQQPSVPAYNQASQPKYNNLTGNNLNNLSSIPQKERITTDSSTTITSRDASVDKI